MNRMQIFKSSIFNRILVPVIIILAVTVSASTYISFIHEAKILNQTMTEEGMRIAETAAASTINSFSSLNWIYTEKLLKQAKKNYLDLVFIKIVNPLHEVYLASHEKYYGETVALQHITKEKKFLNDFPLTNSKETGLLITYPFKVGVDVWHVLVGISEESIKQVKTQVLYRSAVTGLVIILVGIIFSFIISRSISTPIIQLSNAVMRISQGEFETIEINSKDEIGLLGRNFNDMTLKLQKTLESLEKHQQNLEITVKERTKKLEEAQDRLINQAVEAGRAQLSAMILHNIGNAITPVIIGIEKLGSGKSYEINSYLGKCYDAMAKNREHLGDYITKDPEGEKIFSYMGELINALEEIRIRQDEEFTNMNIGLEYVSDILTLQQSYSSDKLEAKQQTDLSSLIVDAVKMQKVSIEQHGIQLVTDLNTSVPLLMIEKNKLMQVIVNLIKNSYDAIDSHLKINATADKWINIKIFYKPDKAGVIISDSGIGVDKTQLDKIFKFGVSSKGSSGFGLYYSKTFMESNNGTLILNSKGHQKGASVCLEFFI
jgi:signal transduction histidine kinase